MSITSESNEEPDELFSSPVADPLTDEGNSLAATQISNSNFQGALTNDDDQISNFQISDYDIGASETAQTSNSDKASLKISDVNAGSLPSFMSLGQDWKSSGPPLTANKPEHMQQPLVQGLTASGMVNIPASEVGMQQQNTCSASDSLEKDQPSIPVKTSHVQSSYARTDSSSSPKPLRQGLIPCGSHFNASKEGLMEQQHNDNTFSTTENVQLFNSANEISDMEFPPLNADRFVNKSSPNNHGKLGSFNPSYLSAFRHASRVLISAEKSTTPPGVSSSPKGKQDISSNSQFPELS